jgi:hypothetical protein
MAPGPHKRIICTLPRQTCFVMLLGQAGYRADNFDWELRPDCNDLLSVVGFLLSVRLALQMVRSGLLFGGVPCSLFVFISLGTSMRSPTCPDGNVNLESVRRSNALASRFTLLAMIALARGAHFVIEQPSSSRLPLYTNMRELLQNLSDLQSIFFTRFNMACLGALSLKPTMLFGSTWDSQLAYTPRERDNV